MNNSIICLCLSFVLVGCAVNPIRRYEAGYRDGAAASAIKDRYFHLRRMHHPEQWNGGGNVMIYPIPVPEHDLNGSRIAPTTRNLVIQK